MRAPLPRALVAFLPWLLLAALIGPVEAQRRGKPVRGRAAPSSARAKVRAKVRAKHRHTTRRRGRRLKGRRAAASVLVKMRGKHRYTAKHMRRVGRHAEAIARQLGLRRGAKAARLAGLLHDAGKLAVDGKVLDGRGELSAAGKAEIHQHPEAGKRILESHPEPPSTGVLEAVSAHHERWDGGGYPRGLSGRRIPLLARIIAVADAYDAMTTQRSYNKPMSKKQAIRRLREASGTQFDPQVVEAFVEVLRRPNPPAGAERSFR